MKRILITGADSYIGTSFERYIKTYYPGAFQIDTLDMRGSHWREVSFAGYDSVFHVAGIAHSDNGRISEEKAMQYYRVNTDLAAETARKAKADGAGQFVFMSSIIVYGDSAPLGKCKTITKETLPKPANCYGDSKYQAEVQIRELSCEHFRVVILRPPMIYGSGSKGNYPLLAKIASHFPIFPAVNNQRSMLYVESLCEFVRLMVCNREQGIFFPQNGEYSNTSELVRMIASAHGKQIRLVKGCTWILQILRKFTGLVDKAFGSMCYDMTMSEYPQEYRKYTLRESIERTEMT